jgi:hypothetical protein
VSRTIWAFVGFGLFSIAIGLAAWVLPPLFLVPVVFIGTAVGWLFGASLERAQKPRSVPPP